MTENLAGDLSIYHLWRSEAVRALVIPTRLFVSPADGSPSLTSFHLAIVHSFFLLHNIKVFIRPGGLYSSSTDIDSLRPYIDYVRDLYHTLLVGKAEILPALLFPPSQPPERRCETLRHRHLGAAAHVETCWQVFKAYFESERVLRTALQ